VSSVEFEAADFCRISDGGDPQKEAELEDCAGCYALFVVTKKDITLDPESRRNISASIESSESRACRIPVAQGQGGTRYALFDCGTRTY
jgi:hypothetical protein